MRSRGSSTTTPPVGRRSSSSQWRPSTSTMRSDGTRGKKKREVERILQQLSELIAEHAEQIVESVEIAAEIDFIFAKGRLALDWNAVRPRAQRRRAYRHSEGSPSPHPGRGGPRRRPLGGRFHRAGDHRSEHRREDGGPQDDRAICPDGPSRSSPSGGEGSEVGLFTKIFADIGDEQSIEQSLSTFSSHMANIVPILQEVDTHSLVLLDELGAGTDPAEGSALAIALLEHLIETGCRVAATTHYGALKSLAYTHPQIENASVQFDVETLRPTYRLSIGHAGKSHAFAIAERLGLAPEVIERARRHLSEEEREVENLLGNVEESRVIAEREREEATRLKRHYLELPIGTSTLSSASRRRGRRCSTRPGARRKACSRGLAGRPKSSLGSCARPGGATSRARPQGALAP